MEWLLEIALIVLLAATLFHALRLERALGVLKRDRAALEELVRGFNTSTQAAEHGIDRLRAAADGAGRQIARQVDIAQRLKDDLQFLADRGERVADRLEQSVRAGRGIADPPRPAVAETSGWGGSEPETLAPPPGAGFAPAGEPPVAPLRSQAERDLMKALRLAR